MRYGGGNGKLSPALAHPHGRDPTSAFATAKEDSVIDQAGRLIGPDLSESTGNLSRQLAPGALAITRSRLRSADMFQRREPEEKR